MIIEDLHLLDGQLFVAVLVLGVEDDAVGAFADHLAFLKLADESAIEGVH